MTMLSMMIPLIQYYCFRFFLYLYFLIYLIMYMF